MSKNTSVSLGLHFTKFVESQVEQGRYGSTSEVLRAGLRLLEEQELKTKLLREKLLEGENSGEAREFHLKSFIEKKKAR